jgi:RHS repeat-associated protein
MGQAESYVFDGATGVKTQLTDINNLITTWTVDGLGRALSKTLPDGNMTSWAYKQCGSSDCINNVSMVTIQTESNAEVPSGVPELSYTNTLGQVMRTLSYGFNGNPIAIDHAYDAQARQLADYQPVFVAGPGAGYESGVLAVQRSEIDNLNRTLQSETRDTGGTLLNTTTTYAGATRTIVNPDNEIRIETRDVLGQLIEVATPAFNSVPVTAATTTLFAHDPFGNLTRTTDPAGNFIIVTYDTMGHKLQLNDPDLGIINYSVDPLGRTWQQVSPKENAASQATTFQYDYSDRMISRIEPDLNSYFIYDVTAATGAPLTSGQITSCQTNHSCGKLIESYTAPAANGNVGAINSVSSTKESDTTYNFDSLGRPANNTVTLDPTTLNYFYSETDYDAWSRPITVIYQHGTDEPKTYAERYNNMGYLQNIQRGGLVLWQVLTQDAANRVVTAQLASAGVPTDGLIATRCYDANTGRLDQAVVALNASAVTCTSSPATYALMESYTYDPLGNVDTRTEGWNQNITGTVASQSFNEQFTYDGLNRIYTSTVSGQTQQAFTYSVDGSIVTKTGEGTYTYTGGTSGGPHAVKTITGTPGIPGTFSYDIDGNQLTGNGRTNTWTSFDMPLSLTYTNPNTSATSSSQFTYGPNHERRTQLTGSGAMTYYGGAQEVVWTAGALTEVKTYWPHGIGVEIDRPGQGASELDWTHTDNLGSIAAITDANGNLKEALGFDAWGSRRNAVGAPPVAYGSPQLTEQTDDKGYTGQEQLDSLELVHLNGRVYDPLISKFLSGDPFVSEPTNGQNYNRYSYVLNNPMNRTDPTGFYSIANAEQWTTTYMSADSAAANTAAAIITGLPGGDVLIFADGHAAQGAFTAGANGSPGMFAISQNNATNAVNLAISSNNSGDVKLATNSGTGAPLSGQPSFSDGVYRPGTDQTQMSQISQFQSHTGVPFVDSNGQQILDMSGNPMMRPSDAPPGFFVQKGQEALQMENALIKTANFSGQVQFLELANFRIGQDWDVQRVGGDHFITMAFRDYANVAIGIYAAAAGIPKDLILNISELGAVTGGSKWRPDTVMDSTYTHLPMQNVFDISLGHDLYTSGQLK